MDKTEIYKEVRETTIRRINRLIQWIDDLLESRLNLEYENSILKRYKLKLEDKLIKITGQDNITNVHSLDISEIERDLVLIIEDVRFKEKYPHDPIDFLKKLFYKVNFGLIIINSNMFEYYESGIFETVFFIGAPLTLLYERQYIPLLGHEIGHHFYKKSEVFKRFDSKINLKISQIEEDALHPATFNHIDRPLLAKAEFLKRILPEWKGEFFADLFATSIWNLKYVRSFAVFQLDKAYFSYDESDPTNKLRFEIMLKLLEMSGCEHSKTDDILKTYNGLIHSDSALEAKIRGVFTDELKSTIVEDFEIYIKNNKTCNRIKEEMMKLEYLH